MDDFPGQSNEPVIPAPPPPPSPPTFAAPQAYPAVGVAPVPAPPAGPRKKKTWLWVVIGLVVLGLLGCCVAVALGGFALFSFGEKPESSIDALNQAALDGDDATFEKYFDADSVTRSAYEAFIDYVKGTPDYAEIVAELGEAEADRLLREEIMPVDTFVQELSEEFRIDSLEAGQVPFPEYSISASSVEGAAAEITIVTVEDGENVTYVLGLVKETYGGEDIWRIKEIKNLAEMLEDSLGT
jgi:hypothetical protein